MNINSIMNSIIIVFLCSNYMMNIHNLSTNQPGDLFQLIIEHSTTGSLGAARMPRHCSAPAVHMTWRRLCLPCRWAKRGHQAWPGVGTMAGCAPVNIRIRPKNDGKCYCKCPEYGKKLEKSGEGYEKIWGHLKEDEELMERKFNGGNWKSLGQPGVHMPSPSAMLASTTMRVLGCVG